MTRSNLVKNEVTQLESVDTSLPHPYNILQRQSSLPRQTRLHHCFSNTSKPLPIDLDAARQGVPTYQICSSSSFSPSSLLRFWQPMPFQPQRTMQKLIQSTHGTVQPSSTPICAFSRSEATWPGLASITAICEQRGDDACAPTRLYDPRRNMADTVEPKRISCRSGGRWIAGGGRRIVLGGLRVAGGPRTPMRRK